MAPEKRLIDANALKDIFMFFRKMWSEAEILTAVDAAPTVDAVEVVHCAECQHWHESKDKTYGWCCRGKDVAYVSYVDRRAPDDYCSKGERRTDVV